jgi:spectinomycin phosphotransferase
MIEKLPFSDQRIIDCLQNDYGIDVTALIFLPLGADMNASVYKAEARDQSAYFVKLKRGHHHDISTIIIALLQAAGIQQLILPIQTRHGQSTQRVAEFTLMVFPFVEGLDGFNRELTDEQWLLLGKAMQQVHRCDVPEAIQHLIRQETYSSQWREAVRALYVYLESEPPQGDEIALQLQIFMRQHAVAIHRLVDRAEQLALIIQQKETPEFVLCHADIHGGNVLIDENNRIYIVDWDAPMMAPRERDLMFIGGGVANVWNKPHETALFYQGYGKKDVNMIILAYYRHERIVEDIALIGQELLLTSTGGENRVQSYQHFIAQFAPEGVVEIAFSTECISVR